MAKSRFNSKHFNPLAVIIFIVLFIFLNSSKVSYAIGKYVYGEWILPDSILWLAVANKKRDVRITKKEDIRLNDSSQRLYVKGDNYSIAHLAFSNDATSPRLFVQAGPSSPNDSSYGFPCKIPNKGVYTIGWNNAEGKYQCAIKVRREKLQTKSKNTAVNQKEVDLNSNEILVEPVNNMPTIIQVYNSSDTVLIDIIIGNINLRPFENPNSTPRIGNAGKRFIFSQDKLEVQNISGEARDLVTSSISKTFLEPNSWSKGSAASIKILQLAINRSSNNVNYLSPIEQQVIAEINQVRTNPSVYIKKLDNLRQYFDGNLLKLPEKIPLQTNEGVFAVDEAIQFLQNVKPVPSIEPSKGMSLASRDLASDQAINGGIGHTGSDGSTFGQRLNRYGSWQGSIAQNISYAKDTAEGIVMQWLIDDGVPKRGHRSNIVNPSYQQVGVAYGLHPQWRVMCVLDLASGYIEKDSPISQ